jgi:hypothetical protein
MMKKLAFGLALGLSLMTFSSAQAGNLDIAAGGELDLAIETDAITGDVSNFKFKPSPSVRMIGESDDTGFAEAAVHLSAEGKPDGKAYGMASDSNQVWWMDVGVAPLADAADAADTNSGALLGWGMAY